MVVTWPTGTPTIGEKCQGSFHLKCRPVIAGKVHNIEREEERGSGNFSTWQVYQPFSSTTVYCKQSIAEVEQPSTRKSEGQILSWCLNTTAFHSQWQQPWEETAQKLAILWSGIASLQPTKSQLCITASSIKLLHNCHCIGLTHKSTITYTVNMLKHCCIRSSGDHLNIGAFVTWLLWFSRSCSVHVHSIRVGRLNM